MANALTVYDTPDLFDPEDVKSEFSYDVISATAIAAIRDLDDEARIDKMIQVGAAIAMAKLKLPHGTLIPWYKNVLKKSESWCSMYFRLWEDRDYLRDAIDWAKRVNHKLADLYGIEQLLKIVADFKEKVLGANPPPPRSTYKPKIVVADERSVVIISKLKDLVAEAEADLETLRLEVETAPSADAGDERDALVAFIHRVEHRLHVFAETCSRLQV